MSGFTTAAEKLEAGLDIFASFLGQAKKDDRGAGPLNSGNKGLEDGVQESVQKRGAIVGQGHADSCRAGIVGARAVRDGVGADLVTHDD